MSSFRSQASNVQAAQLPVVANYSVVKLGHTGSSKKRLLYVRSDALAFLDASMLAPSAPVQAMYTMGVIKRLIPIPCVHTMVSYEGGKQLHLLVRNEHDVFLWKDDGSPMDDVVHVLLRLTRLSGNPVQYTRESGSIDPDEMRLDKFPQYTSMARRCELRRAKSKVAMPGGPITLQTWDTISSSLPYALDPQKMSASLQKTFDGLHIVMLGSVLVHTSGAGSFNGGMMSSGSGNAAAISRVLSFTPTRFIVCDEDTGREIVSCCLFSLTKVVLHTENRTVTLHLTGESIATFVFSFPQAAKSTGAHVSDDIGVVSNVIRFLMAREGVDLLIVRDGGPSTSWVASPVTSRPADASTAAAQPPQPAAATAVPPPAQHSGAGPSDATSRSSTPQIGHSTAPSLTAAAAPAASTTPTPASSVPTTAASTTATTLGGASNAAAASPAVDLAKQVPDYCAPHGAVASKFKSPHVVLARQVLRLTSKGAWEPRVLLLTVQRRILICDEKTTVKRSVSVDQLQDVCTIVHWEGNALALRIQGEHDLVVRHHPDVPSTLTIPHMVLILQQQAPGTVHPRQEDIEGKERLKDILLRERPMKRGTTFVSPTAEAMQKKRSSLSPTASVHAPTLPPSPSASRNASVVAPSSSGDAASTRQGSSMVPPHQAPTAAPTAPTTSTPPQDAAPLDAGAQQPQPTTSAPHATERHLSFVDDVSSGGSALSTAAPQAAASQKALNQAEKVVHPPTNSTAAATVGASRGAMPTEVAIQSLSAAETHARNVVEHHEREDAIDTLEELSALERQAMDAEAQRIARASAEREAAERRRLRDMEQRTTEMSLRPDMHRSIVDMETRSRRMVTETAQEAFERTVQDEETARMWLQTILVSKRRTAAATAAAAVEEQEQAHGEGAGESKPRAPTLPPSSSTLRGQATPPPDAARGVTTDRSPAQVSAAADVGVVERSVGSISIVPSAPPPSSVRSERDDASASEEGPHVLFRREVQLFTPRHVPRVLPSSTLRSTVSRSLDLTAVQAATPNRTSFISANNRLIVFPTPSASDGTSASRGADGSKNCFFRIKVGSSDSIAVVGNEKFASLLHSRFKSDEALSASAALGASIGAEQRVICVSTDEPRIACGDLVNLLDVLRTASMRSWVRRDVVMIRSSSFLWVELGVIPFVVAVERNERPAQIANKLLDGGAHGSSALATGR